MFVIYFLQKWEINTLTLKCSPSTSVALENFAFNGSYDNIFICIASTLQPGAQTISHSFNLASCVTNRKERHKPLTLPLRPIQQVPSCRLKQTPLRNVLQEAVVSNSKEPSLNQCYGPARVQNAKKRNRWNQNQTCACRSNRSGK